MLQPTVFQRAHVHLADDASAELSEIAAVFGGGSVEDALLGIVDAGFGAILAKLQDGQDEENVGFLAELRQRRATAGIAPERLLLGGWSQNRKRAVDDAEKTNGLIAREGAELWSSSCEFEYKAPALPDGSPDHESEPFKRMAAFVDRALGTEPLGTFMRTGRWGVSYMPNEAAGTFMDFASINRAAGRYTPECYPNEFPDAPGIWPDQAQRLIVDGFPAAPAAFGHPLLGFYGDRHVPAEEYVESLGRAKALGLSQGGQPMALTFGYGVWLGKGLTRSDWLAFKDVNAPVGTLGPRVLAHFPA